MINNPESSLPHHVSNDIPENSKASPMRKRYTRGRDLIVMSQNQVIGEPSQGVKIKSSFRTKSKLALIFEIQPECIDEALQDLSWIDAMQEESKVWTLIPLPKGQSIIGTRLVFGKKTR